MAWSGLNFRSTIAFVTDGSGETYVRVDTYPTTRGGLTFGYTSLTGLEFRDRSASLDRRIAGMHFGPAAGRTFRFDLPGGAGTYRVRVLFGDNDIGWSHQCVIKDGAGGSTLATITGTTSSARWLDADGTTSITAANVAADAFGDVELTFTASVAEFVFGNGSSSPHSTIAHIAVEAVSSGSTGTAAGAATVSAAGASTASTTATAAAGVATVSGVGGGVVALVSSVFKNNTGTALASLTNVTAWVNAVESGALVVKLTSQTTNASGICTLQDAAIVTATQYRVTYRNEATGDWGSELVTAT